MPAPYPERASRHAAAAFGHGGVRAKAFYPAFGFALLEIALYGAGPLESDVSLRLADRRARCAAVSQKREPRILGGHRGAARAVLRRAVRHSVFFIGGWQMAFSWWVSGIPYDVIHCVSNTVLVFVLFPPLRRALERAKKTSGGRE